MKTLIAVLVLLVATPTWAATCSLLEFRGLIQDNVGRVLPLGVLPPLASQMITATTSTQSAVFNAQTNFIRIQCDEDVHFEVGENPTATTALSARIGAGGVEYFAIDTRNYRIAFVEVM